MDPNQPSYQPAPSGPPNQYDFIMNPSQPTKPPKLGGNSMTTRLIVVVAGAILLLTVVSIAFSLFSSAGKKDTNALKALVAQQQELIRVAELGADRALDYKTRSLAYTAKLSVTTQQQELISYLSGRGISVSKEELAAKRKPSVDTELESAAANNRFDETFSATLDKELQSYAVAMKEIYNSIGSQKTKDILSESFKSSVTLIGSSEN